MKTFSGNALSWRTDGPVVEVELHRPPANEIGSAMLSDLEHLADALPDLEQRAATLLWYSSVPAGFSAGAHLRELYRRMLDLPGEDRVAAVRDFLLRVHRVFNALDESSLVTIAALHGVVFGGGLELALTCDISIADRQARFGFPELRLGLVPAFGGTARLARDVGGSVVRDLVFTGRSLNATRAHELGLVSQVVAEGRALEAARGTAAQITKLDHAAAVEAKRLVKRVPKEELEREVDVFCLLFVRPEVEAALERFFHDTGPMPYLP